MKTKDERAATKVAKQADKDAKDAQRAEQARLDNERRQQQLLAARPAQLLARGKRFLPSILFRQDEVSGEVQIGVPHRDEGQRQSFGRVLGYQLGVSQLTKDHVWMPIAGSVAEAVTEDHRQRHYALDMSANHGRVTARVIITSPDGWQVTRQLVGPSAVGTARAFAALYNAVADG